ncbi:MAG: hypothetical protein ACREMK_04210 [Gemmatimonadota bacterium]
MRNHVRAVAGAVAVLLAGACGSTRLSDLPVPRPVPARSCLVIGFLGGNDRRDDETKGVRRLALRLREEPRVYTETFANRQLGLALRFLEEALDVDRSGKVEPLEAHRVRLVIYGQSLGGWATVVFARLLQGRDIPVHLTIQIDSVGADDGAIPPNVRYAANLYQDEGSVIAGQHPIRPVDAASTRIVGEWEFDYDRPPGSQIEVDDQPWHKTFLRADHLRMDRDPRVWRTVQRLVEAACAGRDLERAAPEGAAGSPAEAVE